MPFGGTRTELSAEQSDLKRMTDGIWTSQAGCGQLNHPEFPLLSLVRMTPNRDVPPQRGAVSYPPDAGITLRPRGGEMNRVSLIQKYLGSFAVVIAAVALTGCDGGLAVTDAAERSVRTELQRADA